MYDCGHKPTDWLGCKASTHDVSVHVAEASVCPIQNNVKTMSYIHVHVCLRECIPCLSDLPVLEAGLLDWGCGIVGFGLYNVFRFYLIL